MNTTPNEQQRKNNRPVTINAQYVKDLSFENPNAPRSLVGQKSQPKIDIGIDIKAQNLQENTYEIVLSINAKASGEGVDLFLVEIAYAGIFTVANLPENEKEMFLMVFCPNMLFPFARRIIADTVRDGGFPPLMLDPIDFGLMYQQRKQNAEQEAVN